MYATSKSLYVFKNLESKNNKKQMAQVIQQPRAHLLQLPQHAVSRTALRCHPRWFTLTDYSRQELTIVLIFTVSLEDVSTHKQKISLEKIVPTFQRCGLWMFVISLGG